MCNTAYSFPEQGKAIKFPLCEVMPVKTIPAKQIPLSKTLLIMKLTAIILISACVTASATGFGQTISLSEKNAYLSEVFKKIEKQTDYTFAYTGSQLSQAKKVTVEINNGTLEQVLALCFKDQPFTYTIIERTIVVKPKIEDSNEQATSQPPLIRPDQQATIELVTQVQKPLLEMINKLQNRVAELERELGSVYGLLERASSPTLEPPPELEEPPPPVPESKKRHWWQL